MLDTLKTWWKSTFNEIAVFTQLRTFKKDSLSLREFMNNATRLVDECNYPDDARDRLLRDITVSEVCRSQMQLNSEDAIKICQSEDSTEKQVVALWPYLQTTMSAHIQDSADLHKVTPRVGRLSTRNSPQPTHKQWECAYCRQNTRHSRTECPVWGAEYYNCKSMGHYGGVCQAKLRNWPQQSPETIPIKSTHEAQEQEYEDCMPEYTPTYLKFMAETHQISAVPSL